MGEGARADALRVGDVAHGEDAPVGQAAQAAIGGDAGARWPGRCRPPDRAPARFGRRPTATSRWLPAIRRPSARTSVGPGSTAVTAAPSSSVTPRADSASRSPATSSGSSLPAMRRRLDHGDPAAEAGEGVGHLQPDRAAAEDQQVLGPFRQIEQRGVGQDAGTPSSPGIGGTAARAAGGDDDAPRGEPPAADRSARRARRSGPRRAARWRRGRDSAPRNRSARCAAITPCTCALHGRPSRSPVRAGGCRSGRRRAPPAAAWTAASSALLGTQPKFRQSPPIRSRSISATRRPSWAATAVTDRPAAPAPITARSKSGIRAPPAAATRPAAATAPPGASSGPQDAGEKMTAQVGRAAGGQHARRRRRRSRRRRRWPA